MSLKRIVVILIIALILIPGVNAQEIGDNKVTETTVHYGSESVFLNYGYVLDPNDSVSFDLYPLSYLYLQFSINDNETVQVTDITLSRIKIICPLVIEVPNGNNSDLSSYVALCLSDGSTLFEYDMVNHYEYWYSNYYSSYIWVDESFILYVANHENVSLVTLLNLEFTYSFTYEVTRLVDPDISRSVLELIVTSVSLATFLLGICIGWWCRGQNDENKKVV